MKSVSVIKLGLLEAISVFTADILHGRKKILNYTYWKYHALLPRRNYSCLLGQLQSIPEWTKSMKGEMKTERELASISRSHGKELILERILRLELLSREKRRGSEGD